MEHKNLSVTLKADEEGSVKAVFSTLNVIDKDGDVTLPGAFTSERVNIAAWGHNWGALPAGDGVIREAKEEAVFEGSFYLGTPQGDATYQTLKQRHERGFSQEWSYGFDVIEAEPGVVDGKEVRLLKKLKVYEVSPVMVGAGEGTRTLAMKGLDVSFDEHTDQMLKAFGEWEAHSEQLRVEVEKWVARCQAGSAERQKSGRAISEARRVRIESVSGSLRAAADDLESLIAGREEAEAEEPTEQLEEPVVVEEPKGSDVPPELKALMDRAVFLLERY